MKKLYLLFLLTLVAVILDIGLFHSPLVKAQPGSTIHIERLPFGGKNTTGDAPVIGHFIGFQCVDSVSGPQCFVASSLTAPNAN